MTRYLLKQFVFSAAIVLAMMLFIFIVTLIVYLDSTTLHIEHLEDNQISIHTRDAFQFISSGTTLIETTTIEDYKLRRWNSGLDRWYGQWFVDMARGKMHSEFIMGLTPEHRSTIFSAVAGIPATLKLLLGGLFMSFVLTALAITAATGPFGPTFQSVGRVLNKIGPAIPVFIVGVILAKIYLSEVAWSADLSRTSWPTYILASLTLGIVMAFGMIRVLGPVVLKGMKERVTEPGGQGSKLDAGQFWIQSTRRASLKLLASSPAWLLTLLAALIATEMIFEFSNGLGSMARFAGRNPEAALTIGAVMMLTVAYALALFIANVIRGFLDPGIPQSASAPISEYYGHSHDEECSHIRSRSRTWPVFGRMPWIAMIILAVVMFLAVLSNFTAPHDLERNYFAASMRIANLPPVWVEGGSWDNVLGTDVVGRDLMGVALIGTRNSYLTVVIVLGAAASTAVLAVVVAYCLGDSSSRALTWLSRLTLAFPVVLAAVVWASTALYWIFPSPAPTFSPEWLLSCLFIGLLAMLIWGKYVRRIRAEVGRTQSDTLMIQLKSIGAGKWWMLSEQARLVAPRLPWMILIISISNAGKLLIMVSIINFITFSILGVSRYTGWGDLTRLSLSQPHIWWTAMFQGIAIVLTVLSLNFLGAWLREQFDPPPRPADSHNTQAELRLRPERPGEPSK